ncbi:MAG TPA: ribonuclease PH [Candidatus Megaira endosymbiont of Hartmannula sinica]|nr:ribonuclease PH [Candidatus Megaera endosymbiont of Hartmannula sinica]
MRRSDKRSVTDIREIEIIPNFIKNADGSCLVKWGNTHIICTANLDESVPRFLKFTKNGWLTAEYSLLPSSTHTRVKREISSGKASPRTLEIQRLISRSLRSSLDLTILGEKQIIIDCDVINADGGTRCAGITGGFVALSLAVNNLIKRKILRKNPIKKQIAAISCGLSEERTIIVDLNYKEDSSAITDANFVFDSENGIVEIQSTAEKDNFSKEEFVDMLDLSQKAIAKIMKIQNKAILNI